MEEAAKGSAPMTKHMSAMLGDLCKAFYERYGKEALPIIAEVSSKGGVAAAEIRRKTMPVKGMKDFDELFKMMDSTMGLGMEIIELSDDAIHIKVSRCPHGIEGTSRELCEAMMISDVKMMSTLLGQELEMKILKAVAAGDEKCEVIFSKK